MKKAYCGSLCYQGIRGGGIFIDNKSVIYKNKTLTLPEEYKNIVMPIKEIEKIEKGCMLFFPTVKIYLKDQKSYKFIIFNRKKFLEEMMKHQCCVVR